MTRKSTTEWVPLQVLDVDPTVNTRPIKQSKVAEIAAEFDPDKLRYIEVSERPNGRFVILDGQHRVAALRKLGWDNGQMVECKIHRGCSHQRECALFDGLNNQQQMQAIPRMLARIGANEQPDAAINEVVASVGLTIGINNVDGVIHSATALYKVYGGARHPFKSEDPELLRLTLRVALSAWGKQKEALRGDVLMGIGIFIARYAGQFDQDALVAKLAAHSGGSLALVGEGRAIASMHSMQLPSAIAARMVSLYNERRRSKKLPDWWKS